MSVTSDSFLATGSTSSPTVSFVAQTGILSVGGASGVRSYAVGGVGDSNTEFVELIHQGSEARLRVGCEGTGQYRRLEIQNGGATAIVVDAYSRIGVGTASPATRLDVSESLSPNTSGADSYGCSRVAIHYGGTSRTTGTVSGILATAQIDDSAWADTAEAVDAYAIGNSSDTASGKSLYAVRMQVKNIGSGTIGHALGWKVNAPVITGGTVGVAFGGYIADQHAAGTGDSSALHVEGAGAGNAITFSGGNGSALNARLFSPAAGVLQLAADRVGLGTTPALFHKFAVAGDLAADSGLAIAEYVCTSLVASSDGDLLASLYLAPSFDAGSKSSVKEFALYSPTAGTIYFNGKVGVGLDTPDSALHVASHGKFEGNLTTNGRLFVNSGIAYFGGSVGIGTSSPRMALDVNGHAEISGNLTTDGDLYVNSGVGRFAGSVGVGTTNPTISDGNGVDINGKILRIEQPKTVASPSLAGNQGEICWDSDYVYVCVASGTWKRAALATW